MNTDSRRSVETIRQRVLQARDELRVQLDLARKDARVALASFEPVWTRIESQLEDAATALGDQSEAARLQGTLALMEARERMAEIGKVMNHLGEEARSDGYTARRQLDVARLQVALAGMEARDTVVARAKRAETEARRLGADAVREAEKAAEAVTTAARDLRKWLSK